MPLSANPLALSSYQFNLPPELIAQYPVVPRDQSRLMVIERKSGHISEIIFSEISDLMESGEGFIFNDTKVIPARLFGQRKGGGQAEILLIKQLNEISWQVMARPGKKLPVGTNITFGLNFSGSIEEIFPDGSRRIQLEYQGDFDSLLLKYGQLPLPPYIRKGKEEPVDRQGYQTVFAAYPGALAAPTAGLHFTAELLNQFEQKKIHQTYLTLHTGLGTFKPVKTADITAHPMHCEKLILSSPVADFLNEQKVKGHRQVCVGTTCCRALETVADQKGQLTPGHYETSLFIYPGYKFKYMQALLTNFHLPGSSLLMLVSAWGGYELIQEAYAKAIEQRFRFFSYGDAMLII